MFNKISSFFSVLSIVTFLFVFSANDVFAQKRQMPPGNSTIPILSETTMNRITVEELDIDQIIVDITTLIFDPTNVIFERTMEAKVAATLVNSLTEAQMATFSKNTQTINGVEYACIPTGFCTSAKCSDLVYSDMWYDMGLCVK